MIASAGGGQRSTQAAASANLAAGRKARRNRGKDKQTGQLAGGPAPLKQHRQQQQQQRQQRQPPRQLQRGNAASAPAAPAKGIVVTLQNEYYRPAPAVRDLLRTPASHQPARVRFCGGFVTLAL